MQSRLIKNTNRAQKEFIAKSLNERWHLAC